MTETGKISVQVSAPRSAHREPGDFTLGCGQLPMDYQPGQPFKSGRVCAGLGTQPSCMLCPESPTYWRDTWEGE